MRGKANNSIFILALLLLAGSIIGSAIWSLLAPYLPKALSANYPIGTTANPWVLDISFLKLTFGFVLKMNLGSIIGVLIGLFFYYR